MTVPLYNLTDAWNNAGTVFTAIGMNVTNTASAAGSKLLDLQIGGTTGLSYTTDGFLNITNLSGTVNPGINTTSTMWFASGGGVNGFYGSVGFGVVGDLGASQGFQFRSSQFASDDVRICRDGANAISVSDGTTATSLRVYNTYTNASNYERGALDWTTTANVLTIGTQKLGTGSVRNIQFVVGNTAQADFGITTSGAWTFNATTYVIGDCRVSGGNVRIDNGTVLYWSGADLFLSRKAANVFSLDAGAVGDSNATINAKTKAGAPTTSDVPAGTWVLIRDTSGATTKLYYNNAGTLQSVALV